MVQTPGWKHSRHFGRDKRKVLLLGSPTGKKMPFPVGTAAHGTLAWQVEQGWMSAPYAPSSAPLFTCVRSTALICWVRHPCLLSSQIHHAASYQQALLMPLLLLGILLPSFSTQWSPTCPPEPQLSHHILTEACLISPPLQRTKFVWDKLSSDSVPCFLRWSRLISFPHICITNVWLCHCVTIQAPLKKEPYHFFSSLFVSPECNTVSGT